MNDPYSIKSVNGGKNLVGLIAVAIVIIAVIAGIIAVIALYPNAAANVLVVACICIGIFIAGLIIIWAILALVVGIRYVAKGEQYQDKMLYDLDDVKSVKETSSDDKKE